MFSVQEAEQKTWGLARQSLRIGSLRKVKNPGKDKTCPKFLKALDVVGLFHWLSLYNTAILGQTLLLTGVISHFSRRETEGCGRALGDCPPQATLEVVDKFRMNIVVFVLIM